MAAGNLSKQVQSLLVSKGFSLIHLHKCEDDLSSFSKALSDAVDYNTYGPYVDKHTPEDLRASGTNAFLSRNKMAGVAVWPDGNIGAVFNDGRSPHRNAIGELMLTALSVGGNKLDCYNGPLRRLYAKFGFIPVARVKFNPQYAPKNWRKDLKEPDIIFWIHCGDSAETVAQKIGSYPTYSQADVERLRYFDDYAKAGEYRDEQQAIFNSNCRNTEDN